MKKLSDSVQKRGAAAVIEARPAPAVIADERVELIGRIKRLLVEQDAVVVAHYYTHQDLQMLAEETGGLSPIPGKWPVSVIAIRPAPWWLGL